MVHIHVRPLTCWCVEKQFDSCSLALPYCNLIQHSIETVTPQIYTPLCFWYFGFNGLWCQLTSCLDNPNWLLKSEQFTFCFSFCLWSRFVSSFDGRVLWKCWFVLIKLVFYAYALGTLGTVLLNLWPVTNFAPFFIRKPSKNCWVD